MAMNPNGASGPGLADILMKVQESNAMMQRSNTEAATKPPTIVAESTGGETLYSVKGLPQADMQQVFQALQFQKQAMAGYEQERMRLEDQERRLSTGPGKLFNVLATVASNLATSDPRLPPLVSALGRSSKQLNPTLQEVRDRRLGILGEEAQLGGQGASLAATMYNQEESRRIREQGQTDARLKEQHVNEDRDTTRTNTLLKNIETQSRLIAYRSHKPMDEESFNGLAQGMGLTDQGKIDELYVAHVSQAQGYKEGRDEAKQTDIDKIQARGAEQRKGIAMKAGFDLERQREHDETSFNNAMRKITEGGPHKIDIDATKKMTIPDVSSLKALGELNEYGQFFGEMGKMIDDPKYGGKLGATKIGNYVSLPFKDPARVKMESFVKQELPRVIRRIQGSQGGGASILRSEDGRALIKSLAVVMEMTPAQAKGVLEKLRTIGTEGARAEVNKYPFAYWNEYDGLLGVNAGLRPDGWHPGGVVNRLAQPEAQQGPKQPPPPPKPKWEEIVPKWKQRKTNAKP